MMQLFQKLMIACFALATTANAQETGSRFSLGIQVVPELAGRVLSINEKMSMPDPDAVEAIKDSRNKSETERLGFTTGIEAGVQITKKWRIEMGISYTLSGYKSKKAEYFGVDNLDYMRWKNNYHYIGVPIQLIYNLQPSEFCFYGGVGFVPSVLVARDFTSRYYYTNGSELYFSSKSYQNFNRFSYSALLSAGVNVPLTETISLRAEPQLRFAATRTIAEELPIEENLWSAGVNVSCQISL